MQMSPFPMSGSQDSPAKTSLLHAWESDPGSEAASQGFFMSLLDLLEKAAPDFLSSRTCRVYSVRTVDETSELFSGRWPNSGILSGGVCLTAKTSASPSLAIESSLLGLIETGEVHPRFFLSPNAAQGCLRRTARMGRKLFPHLQESLSILAQRDQ